MRDNIPALSRRQFVRAVGATTLTGALAPQLLADQATVGPKRTDKAETAVA
ncbi:MAG: twin-arginine translocation signal domain-containing protein, partial [bacterium]